MMRVRSTAAALAVIMLGVGLYWAGASRTTDTATPQVVSGTVEVVSADGSEFAIAPSNGGAPEGFGLSKSTPWFGSGSYHMAPGQVPCIKPGSHGQSVRFGVVYVNPTTDAGGGPVVVWVDCRQ
jgi:hypothetical protein